MQKKLVIMAMTLGLLLLASYSAYSQCPKDTFGVCDTLSIERENGRIQPNTSVVRTIKCYWDEQIAGGSVPIKYKNPQTDVRVDSIKFPTITGITIDKVLDTTAGTIILFWVGLTGGSIPPGTYTMATYYFKTGPTWDPAVNNPLDTYTIGGPGGQGLSFVDTAGNDIQPVYNPAGNLDVKDDPGHASGIPKAFNLSQNYPNPFNAVTVISFALPKTGHVNLEVYNILGQKVKDLVDEVVTAGYKRVVWDGKNNSGTDVASGVYFYRIKTEAFVEVMKMTLLK